VLLDISSPSLESFLESSSNKPSSSIGIEQQYSSPLSFMMIILLASVLVIVSVRALLGNKKIELGDF